MSSQIKNLATLWFLLLAASSAALLLTPKHFGDIDEYASMTVAFATHGSPSIRPDDLALAARLLHKEVLVQNTIEGMKQGLDVPSLGFRRGTDGKYYAIHFFAYSALASLPFNALRIVGADPFRCFIFVNLFASALLAYSLYKALHDWRRATFALAFFFLSGGLLYLDWSGPEFFSAAFFLSALALFSNGYYVTAGLLAGAAALQNPPLISFALFAPPIRMTASAANADSETFAHFSNWRLWAGCAICIGVGALAPAFNYVKFGVPSLIAEISTSSDLFSTHRFTSYLADLNQGLLLAFWGAALGTAALLYYQKTRLLAVTTIAFVACLGLPTLITQNWNSGCVGIMRYALWGGVPLIAGPMLVRSVAWPKWMASIVLVGQLFTCLYLSSYSHLEFSPLARVVMERMPSHYLPEPEIFFERQTHSDSWGPSANIAQLKTSSGHSTTLYHAGSVSAAAALCGPGYAPAGTSINAGQGWRYLRGPISCQRQWVYELNDLRADLQLESGWNDRRDSLGGEWNGAWTIGTRTRFRMHAPKGAKVRNLMLVGHYLTPGNRTRVKIDGVDMGWVNIGDAPVFELKHRAVAEIEVELEERSVHTPTALLPDPKQYGLFLQRAILM